MMHGFIHLQQVKNALIPCLMKRIMWMLLAACTLMSSACNTFIGLGRDMRQAGEGMEKVASKASGGGGESTDSGAPVY